MPVIDYQQHLLGIITIDDILDVMDEEASEDYSRLAGVSDIDSTNDSVVKTVQNDYRGLLYLHFRHDYRYYFGSFEATLSQVALLAAFIPIISGMSEILVHNHLRCLYVHSLLGKLMNKVNLRLH